LVADDVVLSLVFSFCWRRRIYPVTKRVAEATSIQTPDLANRRRRIRPLATQERQRSKTRDCVKAEQAANAKPVWLNDKRGTPAPRFSIRVFFEKVSLNDKKYDDRIPTCCQPTGAVHRLATEYRDAGISIFPIRLDGSKGPALDSWKPYHSRIANDDELSEWFSLGCHGIGLVYGLISGVLEVSLLTTAVCLNRGDSKLIRSLDVYP
jgi:hypothetical protein